MKKNLVLMIKIKKNHKVRDHWHYTGKYRGASHNNCNLRYKIPKEISQVFHNGSTYGYKYIIKQLAREFKGNCECIKENTEKYITFFVPIKKEHSNGKPSIYRLKFIIVADSCSLCYQILLIIYQRFIIKALKINLLIA